MGGRQREEKVGPVSTEGRLNGCGEKGSTEEHKIEKKRKEGGKAGEQERGGTLTGHGPMPVARRWKLLGNSTGSG